MKRLIPFFLLLVLSGCSIIKKPPYKEVPESIPKILTSSIGIPINIDINKIEEAIRMSIQNPVASGRSDEIDIKILATKKITERQVIKKLVKPAQPGYYVTRYKEISKTVKKAYNCLLNPLKWGTCYKDVIEIVKVPYEVWIEPAEAIYDYVSGDITKLLDETFDISGWINHKVLLKSFDLGISGNNIISTTKLKIEIDIDYKQNLIPLGPDIKIKGALSCSIEAEISINGTINLGDDADLIINIPNDGGQIKFTKICIPEAVETFDIVALLNPVLLIIKDEVGKKLNQKLTEKIVESINERKGDLKFKDEIIANALNASKPKLIGENIWLLPNLNSVLYTNINGENGKLKFLLAIECLPKINYSEQEPEWVLSDNLVKIKKVNSINSNTQLLIDVAVTFYDAQNILNTEIDHFQKSKYPNLSYYLGNSQIYPSNDKVVISLDLFRKKNSKRKLSLYVWGIPKYDSNKSQIYLDNLDFTLESKHEILKYISAVFEKEIIDELKKSSRWNISKEKQKLHNSIKDIKYKNKNLLIKGGFPVLDITQVFVTNDKFKFYTKATGHLTMEVDP